MTAAILRFTRTGHRLTAAFTGTIDFLNSDELFRPIAAQMLPDDEEVRLDVSAVTSCVIAGLVGLAAANRQIVAAGARCTIYHPSPQLVRALDQANLSHRLTLELPSPEPAAS